MSDFHTAVELVLLQEGGLHTDPNDSGGTTSFGISQRAYPQLDIAKLSRDEAIAIYRKDFWKFDNLFDLRLGCLMLSMAVNLGLGTAVRVSQKALGIAQDGLWGPLSDSAANRDPKALLKVAVAFLRHYIELGKDEYQVGWLTRILECLAL